MHAHLREGEMLTYVVSEMIGYDHVLVMPNTRDPILEGGQARAYKAYIEKEQKSAPDTFCPLMTLQITEQTTPDMIYTAREVIIAGKVYPRGMTTNSGNGVLDYSKIYPALSAMEDIDMVLCLHGEKPGEFCLEREEQFLSIIREIMSTFPSLRIVLEHITTCAAVEYIKQAPANVAATITVHHLSLTLDDVIGAELRPHHFCKPVAKCYGDREALRNVVRSGHPRFFLGTDSAPHLRGKKECSHGCAGIFTAPSTPALICEFFQGDVEKINRFANEFGAAFYHLSPTKAHITLERWDGSPNNTPRVRMDGPVEIFTGNDDGILPWRIIHDE